MWARQSSLFLVSYSCYPFTPAHDSTRFLAESSYLTNTTTPPRNQFFPSIRLFLATLGTLSGAAIWLRYRAEMRQIETRLNTGSKIAQTTAGPVEYTDVGTGPALLVLHGIGGGYDQGLLVTRLQPDNPFRIVSVSRPGYLRTPLRIGRTPEQQADAYAALLGELGIHQVAVVGISAGGPSALQFACLYPHLCWGLITVAGVSKPISANFSFVQSLAAALLDTDFTLWLLGIAARDTLFKLSGVTPAVRERLLHDPVKMEVMMEILRPLPISRRNAGFKNDLKQFEHLPNYDLSPISAPTMALHGTNDGVVPLSHSEFVVQSIPGARLVTIDGGGHLCVVTHYEEALPTLIDFLQQHAPPNT